MKFLLFLSTIILVGCPLKDDIKQENTEPSAYELEQHRLELENIKQQRELEIERQKELELERIRQEKESKIKNEIDLTAEYTIRQKFSDGCQTNSIKCTDINVYYIDYIGKESDSERYVVKFEVELTIENDIWVTEKDKYQGYLYYDMIDDDTYENDFSITHIGSNSEAGIGTAIGVTAGVALLDWFLNSNN